jgi:muramoyltetrapeptide carboxypeptidase LdcA involved in peptidoglycan recycling
MLREGARIGVVATGGAVSRERLHPGLAWVASCGWRAVKGPHLFERLRFLAGTVQARAADLEWAFTAPDLDAVWSGSRAVGTGLFRFCNGSHGTASSTSR